MLHYYCPVCLWEKRTEYVIFVAEVIAWSLETVLVQREKFWENQYIWAWLVLVWFVVCPLAREQMLALRGSLADIYREWGNEGTLLLSDDTPHDSLNDIEHFLAANGCNIAY